MPTLQFSVTANTDDAKKSLAGLNDSVRSGSEKTKGALGLLKDSYMNLRTAATDAFAVMQEGWKMATEGAQNIRIADQFKQTADSVSIDADRLAAALDAAAKGTVDDEVYMSAATRDMALGVTKSMDDVVGIMNLARYANKKFGVDTGEAFTQVSESISNLRPMMLRQYGIVVNTKKAYEDYAKSVGKSVEALDEEEQRNAIRIAVMEKSKDAVKAMGKDTLDSADKFKRLEIAAGNAMDSVKEFLANAIVPFLDRMADAKTMTDKNSTAMERYAAAVRLSKDPFGQWSIAVGTGQEKAYLLNQTIGHATGSFLFLGRGLREDTLPTLERLANAQQLHVDQVQKVRDFQDRANTAVAEHARILGLLSGAYRDVQTPAEAYKALQAEVAAGAQALIAAEQAQQTEIYNSATAYQSLAQSLVGLDKADIARAAIEGLKEDFARTGDEEKYRRGVEAIELQYGLVTKASLAAADAQATVTDLYWKGTINTEQMTAALALLPKAAQDGYVSLDELGLKASDLKPKFDDLARISPLAAINAEVGAQATGTLTAVQSTVEKMPAALKTAIDTMNADLPKAVTSWTQIEMAIDNAKGGGVTPAVDHLSKVSVKDFVTSIQNAARDATGDEGTGLITKHLSSMEKDEIPAVLKATTAIVKPVSDNWTTIKNAIDNARLQAVAVKDKLNEIPRTIPVEINITVTGDEIPQWPESGNGSYPSREYGGPSGSGGWYFLHPNEWVLSAAQRAGEAPIPAEAMPGASYSSKNQNVTLIINQMGGQANIPLDYATLQQLAAAYNG